MHTSLVRQSRTASPAPARLRALLLPLLLSSIAVGQIITRPIDPGIGLPIVPGGGGGGPGGGIPGGGIPINPINPILPINPGGGVATGPTIVTDGGVLAGQSSQATVVMPSTPSTAAAPGQSTGSATTPSTTYQWTISGGRITSDPTQSSVRFTAEAAGTLALNVVVVTAGSSQSTSAEVIVLSPALAGSIASPPTAQANAAPLTATVPAAQNGDRTFRWSLLGNGATIVSGQGTNRMTFRPGAPGLVEVMCAVTLQRLATVTLRSFVMVTGDGPPAPLTVNSGTGGGTYPAGSLIDIFAEPAPAGHVFDKWIGDTAILGSSPLASASAHAVVTVPARPATLTATYRAVAEWTPTQLNNFHPIAQTSPSGVTLAYHFPAEAKGVVFLLHDNGGTATSWFTGPERLTLAHDLVAAGYGVAALSSVNRATGAWSTQSTLANNPDLVTLSAALDWFVRESLIAARTPVFFLGIGGGGDAASRFARQLVAIDPARPIKGAVVYCASGDATAAAASRVPQLFALAANDDMLGAAGNAAARENSRFLAGRGIATAVVTNRASPVPAGRLRMLGLTSNGFSSADAEVIWSALKKAGLLDENNYPKSVPTIEAVRAAVPAAFHSRAGDIAAQLAVAYGAPEFYSDANAQVIAFLDGRLANAPAPEPGRLVNLSTRTSIAYLGDTFTLGFTLTGTERATVLVRGLGPALTRFGVNDPLPAPRLEVRRGSTLLAANEGWDQAANAAQIIAAGTSAGAFPLPRGSLDTALLLALEPGAYTATITSINGAVGGVLAEVYDVSKNATRLTNLSTLAKVGIDGEPLTPGMVIVGENPRTLVVRAIGPGLADLGVPGGTVLGDPLIAIVNRTGQTVANNNNWAQTGTTRDPALLSTVFSAAGAFPLNPTSGDAALVNAFSPGSYLVQTTSSPAVQTPFTTLTPASSGAVLVEIYEVP